MAAAERKMERHRVGDPDEFPLGSFKRVRVGHRDIAIVRTSKGYFAIRNSCPHMGAPLCYGKVGGTMLPSAPDELIYGLEDEVVRCPWHSWEFVLSTGQAVGGLITSKRVVTYDVEAGDDGVYVLLRGVTPGKGS